MYFLAIDRKNPNILYIPVYISLYTFNTTTCSYCFGRTLVDVNLCFLIDALIHK